MANKTKTKQTSTVVSLGVDAEVFQISLKNYDAYNN